MATREAMSGVQHLIYDGHAMRYVETLPNFLASLPFVFWKSLTFNCSSSPTSWLLKLLFKRNTWNESVSCDVSIRRSDNIRIYVDTDLWMTVTSPIDNTVCRSKNLTVHHMARHEQAGKYLVNFIPNEVHRQMEDHHHVLLEVTFGVHGCHDERISGIGYFPPTEQQELHFLKL